MSNTVPVTDATFQSMVLDSSQPVLVDFWAEWCAPCRAVAPILEEIAGEYSGSLTVAKMDVDANPVTPTNYRITSIPTMNLYVGGELVKQIVGGRSKSVILSEITPFLKA